MASPRKRHRRAGCRLIRRGVPYVAPPAPPDDNGERGLIGLFLCGSLANQFELLYSWINVNDLGKVFSPGLDMHDALLANRVSPSTSRRYKYRSRSDTQIHFCGLPERSSPIEA